MKRLISKAYDSICSPFYRRYLLSNSVESSRLLILGTLPRSGTHFIKFLFANYLKINSEGLSSTFVSPSEMNEYFPNNFQYSYLNLKKRPLGRVFVNNIKEPTKLLKLMDLDDFTRTHYSFQFQYWKNSPVLHSFRNPLDFSVSIFNYMFKNRQNVEVVKNPFDAFLHYQDYYCRTYLSYLEASTSCNYKLLRISYEDLITDPCSIFSLILSWLGLEPKLNYVEEACFRSSIKNVNKLEKHHKTSINPKAELKTGSFVSSGNIGQWKSFFSPSQIDIVEEKLNLYKISLDDFQLETY
jgi:hypothetical protein